MEPQGIIDLADKIIYEKCTDWICFNSYFSKLLVSDDYDTFIFMFVIWTNKFIENELNIVCKKKNIWNYRKN